MLELGAGADILRALGWLYMGLMALSIAFALWLPDQWLHKALAACLVLLIFVGPAYLSSRERAQLVDERKTRYEAAKALFDERCKTAGERIHRTVENVEGVLLLNVRSEGRTENEANPNWPDAGLANEYGGNGYILNFLLWQSLSSYALNSEPSEGASPGYRYVEVKEKFDVIRRYTLRKDGEMPEKGYPNLTKSESGGALSRYAVSYVNLINARDREHWVAGTTVTVTDSRTSEILAEGTWYSFEPGLGSQVGHRQPWRFARSCPELIAGKERAPTRFFVTKVLKPKN